MMKNINNFKHGQKPQNYNRSTVAHCVIYFGQPLGAMHSKRWSKYVFHVFALQTHKKEKEKQLRQNLAKNLFLGFATKCWLRVIFHQQLTM